MSVGNLRILDGQQMKKVLMWNYKSSKAIKEAAILQAEKKYQHTCYMNIIDAENETNNENETEYDPTEEMIFPT